MDVELLQALRTVIKEEIEPVKKDLENVKQELLVEIKQVKQQITKDISTSLSQYSKNLEEYVDTKTEVLNKRVYKLEVEMERITSQ
jgi:gas vesicle protein